MEESLFYVETIEAIAGNTEELKQALLSAIPLARKEKGILSFDVSQDCENPELFIVLIYFKNRKAYDEHVKADYIQEFMQKYEKRLYGDVTEEFFRKIENL